MKETGRRIASLPVAAVLVLLAPALGLNACDKVSKEEATAALEEAKDTAKDVGETVGETVGDKASEFAESETGQSLIEGSKRVAKTTTKVAGEGLQKAGEKLEEVSDDIEVENEDPKQ